MHNMVNTNQGQTLTLDSGQLGSPFHSFVYTYRISRKLNHNNNESANFPPHFDVPHYVYNVCTQAWKLTFLSKGPTTPKSHNLLPYIICPNRG